MTQLTLRRHVPTVTGRFDAVDDHGQVRYRVTGTLAAWPKTFAIADPDDAIVATVRRIARLGRPAFEVEGLAKAPVVIRQRRRLWRTHFDVDDASGHRATIVTDPLALRWRVIDGDDVVATVTRRILTIADVYAVDLIDRSQDRSGDDEIDAALLAMSAVVAIAGLIRPHRLL